MRPFYERAVSNLDRSMHRSLWVKVAHRSFTTKNTASGVFVSGELKADAILEEIAAISQNGSDMNINDFLSNNHTIGKHLSAALL
jgi:hypothetical protein